MAEYEIAAAIHKLAVVVGNCTFWLCLFLLVSLINITIKR